jgi:type I restriction enzyme, S subunit
MSNEWDTVRFEIAPIEIIDGDRGKNYPKKTDFLQEGYCLFLDTGNVTVTGFNFEECAFITREKDNSLRKGRLQRNDVVLTTRGTVGNVAFFNEQVPHERIRINSGMVILRPNPEKILPRFLYLFLRSQIFKQQIESLTTGSAQPQLPIKDLKRFEIAIPPPEEQSVIARILGALDDKIELNRRMNHTLKAMAAALFKSWFVDFDPVTAKAEGRQPYSMKAETAALFPSGFEDSSLGAIPLGWHVGTLTEIADVVMGASPSGDTYNDVGDGVPLVNGPVEFGDYFAVKTKWTTAPTRLSQEGDLIFCVRGSTTGRRVIADDVYCMGRGVCAIRSKNGRQAFVNQTIDSGLERLLSKTGGSVFPNLSGTDISGFEVLVPQSSLQEAYCQVVDPLVSMAWKNIKQSRTLASIRDSLLPKLLSGEIRVKQAEHIIATA